MAPDMGVCRCAGRWMYSSAARMPPVNAPAWLSSRFSLACSSLIWLRIAVAKSSSDFWISVLVAISARCVSAVASFSSPSSLHWTRCSSVSAVRQTLDQVHRDIEVASGQTIGGH
jgi:hypothetical protein